VKFASDRFVVGKLSAIVRGEGMNPVSMRSQPLNHLLLHRPGEFPIGGYYNLRQSAFICGSIFFGELRTEH